MKKFNHFASINAIANSGDGDGLDFSRIFTALDDMALVFHAHKAWQHRECFRGLMDSDLYHPI